MPPKRKRELDIPGKSDFSGVANGGLAEPQWRACRSMLENVYRRREGNRDVAEIFCELPDKELYEDYYVAITEPECLDNIAKKLGEQEYASPEAFYGQLQLVFLNAKHYNEEGSQVWDDANILENQINQAWEEGAKAGVFDAVSAPVRGSKKGKRVKAERTSATPAPPPPVPPREPTPPPVKEEPKAAAPADHGLSDADKQIVHSTEIRYLRWPGPVRVITGHYPGGIVGSGWWGEGMGIIDNVSKRINEVLDAMRAVNGGSPFASLQTIPANAADQVPFLSYTSPLDMAAIETKINDYRSLSDFDVDMIRLFERARRWYAEQTPEYGQIMLLQRLYQSITGTVQATEAKHNYASIAAGPGKAEASTDEDAVLTRDPGYTERKYTSSARWKGLELKVGDWVHLANPDDPKRPIVGQIWKTYIPTTKGRRTHHVSVAWYYRPEQTVHTAKQQFYKREVLRSGSFCDHPVEDVLERVTVQPWGKYVRGRPKAGDYYPGWPSYVCVNRYSEKAWKISPIQHWQSGLPEEIRNADMPLSYFEKAVSPTLSPSPLHTLKQKVDVPGFFAEPRSTDEGEDLPPTPQKGRAKRPAPLTPMTAAPVMQMPLPPASTETFAMMVGGMQSLDQVAWKDPLPIETSRLFERDARQSVLWFSGPPKPSARAASDNKPTHSLAYLAHLARS